MIGYLSEQTYWLHNSTVYSKDWDASNLTYQLNTTDATDWFSSTTGKLKDVIWVAQYEHAIDTQRLAAEEKAAKEAAAQKAIDDAAIVKRLREEEMEARRLEEEEKARVAEVRRLEEAEKARVEEAQRV